MVLFLSPACGHLFGGGEGKELVVEAHIYLSPWRYPPSGGSTIEMVRKGADCRIAILGIGNAVQLFESLLVEAMTDSGGATEDRNVVVVFDFVTSKGRTLTFYATGRNLYSEDSSSSRRIDDSFKKRFSCTTIVPTL
jgi:hypothetical protein